MGVAESEEPVDRPGTNDWYVVRRVAFYAFFDELWLLTTGPVLETSLIFAEFSG